jgi:hypothetical protein
MRTMGGSVDDTDYRLLSRRGVDSAEGIWRNQRICGAWPLLGFRSNTVYYDRGERVAGVSKYPLRKMISFAVEGVTSFSVKPIRLVITLGFAFALLGVLMALYAVMQALAGHTVSGWASLMVSVWVVGGVQLMALGLIGIYVGKTYTEVKHRPASSLKPPGKSWERKNLPAAGRGLYGDHPPHGFSIHFPLRAPDAYWLGTYSALTPGTVLTPRSAPAAAETHGTPSA